MGKIDKASISEVIVESAISTIIDNEDSVAAVDDEDKVKCYRNWLGLMKGDLTANFEKNGKKITRKLNPDRNYISTKGKKINLESDGSIVASSSKIIHKEVIQILNS